MTIINKNNIHRTLAKRISAINDAHISHTYCLLMTFFFRRNEENSIISFVNTRVCVRIGCMVCVCFFFKHIGHRNGKNPLREDSLKNEPSTFGLIDNVFDVFLKERTSLCRTADVCANTQWFIFHFIFKYSFQFRSNSFVNKLYQLN